eukprot:11474376-Alexandrium_andersonii.AAC.1
MLVNKVNEQEAGKAMARLGDKSLKEVLESLRAPTPCGGFGSHDAMGLLRGMWASSSLKAAVVNSWKSGTAGRPSCGRLPGSFWP